MIFNKIRLIISSWNRFWKFRSTVACSVIITFFSSSISPAFATEMLTDNYDSVSPKTTSQNKGQLKKPSSYKAAKHIANNIEKTNQPCSAPYKPYLEFGGAKYFNQTTNIAGIYDLFIPLFQQEDQLLFTDIRIFDRSGSSAEGNFHLGYRKLIDLTQMFGIYGAFDYKRSNSQNSFQQLTLGLEYWHHNWFAGANIYKPIGITKKYVGETSNQELINNRGIAKIITTNKLYEEALPGIDAELGYALTESLTSYVGGYYFAASGAETVTGPKIRVTYDYLQPVGRILGIVDGISIEAGAQHDKPRGYTAYVGLKFKVGLTNLAKNSNISGFKRHMVELVKRDPDIILNKAQETSQETHKQGKYSQDGEHGFIGGDPSPDQPYSARTDYENWPHEVLLQELGLPANATHNEVRKAYYQLSVVHHPDKARNNNTSQARFNGIYTELKNRHHAAKLRNQTAQATEGVILNLPTATVGENKYYGGGNTKNSNFAKNSRSHITASNYKYSNLDVEKLLASRLIEAKSKITAKNLTITTIAPISQATLSYSHNPQVFSNWLQQELTAQKKVILPVYLDKEEHWVTVIFAKQTNSIVEVKYLDSLTQEPSNWLEILLKNHYADPVHFTFEQFFHQTDNSVGCGAFAIESALLGLNLDINKLNEKNIRHLHQELLNKYQNVPSIIATETTPSAKKPSITFVDLSLILPLSININSSRTMRGGRKTKKTPANNEPPVVSDLLKVKIRNTVIEFTTKDFTDKFSDPEGDSLIKIQTTSLPDHGSLKLGATDVETNQEIVSGDLEDLIFDPEENWNGNTSFGWKGHDGYTYSTDAANVNISMIVTLRPVVVGSEPTSGSAIGVAVAGDYAYVADYDEGLQVINIADSTNPQIVGHKDTDGYAFGVAVAGDYAYVADYDKGLQVINIANSTNPQIVGHTDTVGHAEGVAVAGDYAYVADGSKGLIKINIVIPSSPELVGSVDTGGSARGVAVQGYYSYVAAGNGGLKIMRNEDMPPEIQDIAKSATTNETITFNKTDFTSKYSDPDEDPLNKVKIPTLPNNGTLALFSNAVLADQEIQTAHLDNLIFEPNSTWHGRTYFTWQGYDGFVYSSKAANVTMLIDTPPNFKKEIEKLGNPKQEVKFKKEDFTDVFTDVDNDELEKIEITSMPEKENGILRLSGNTVQINQEIDADELDHLTFEPETQWHGETYFEWKAYDGFEYSVNSTKVNMIIDTPPDIVDFEKLGVSDQDLMFAAQDFDNAYQDVDGDQLAQIKITTLPNTGTLKLLSSPVAANSTIIHNDLVNLVFQLPVSGWQDSTEFNWLGYDGYRYSANSAKVTISISNAKPTIDDLIILGTVDQLLEFEASDFKHGFHDENSNHKLEKIKILSLPDAGGELAFAGKAVEKNQEIKTKDLEDLTFSPQFGWSGKTTFTWAGTDGLNYSDEAKVTIDIPSKNFCSTYWWLCYLIPACLTAAGITASVGMFALKYYLKIRRLKAEAMGDIELANITPLDNPLAGESIL